MHVWRMLHSRRGRKTQTCVSSPGAAGHSRCRQSGARTAASSPWAPSTQRLRCWTRARTRRWVLLALILCFAKAALPHPCAPLCCASGRVPRLAPHDGRPITPGSTPVRTGAGGRHGQRPRPRLVCPSSGRRQLRGPRCHSSRRRGAWLPAASASRQARTRRSCGELASLPAASSAACLHSPAALCAGVLRRAHLLGWFLRTATVQSDPPVLAPSRSNWRFRASCHRHIVALLASVLRAGWRDAGMLHRCAARTCAALAHPESARARRNLEHR